MSTPNKDNQVIAVEAAETWRPSAPCAEINALAAHILAAIEKSAQLQRKDNQCITCGATFTGSWTGECPTCVQKAIERFVAQPQRSERIAIPNQMEKAQREKENRDWLAERTVDDAYWTMQALEASGEHPPTLMEQTERSEQPISSSPKKPENDTGGGEAKGLGEYRTHHNTCPRGERCACYLTGYADAEYDHGHVYESLDDKLTLAEKRSEHPSYAKASEEWTAATVDEISRDGLSPIQDIANAHNVALKDVYEKGFTDGKQARS